MIERSIAFGCRDSIDIKYLPEIRPDNACTSWIEEPAILVHTRYPDNMSVSDFAGTWIPFTHEN